MQIKASFDGAADTIQILISDSSRVGLIIKDSTACSSRDTSVCDTVMFSCAMDENGNEICLLAQGEIIDTLLPGDTITQPICSNAIFKTDSTVLSCTGLDCIPDTAIYTILDSCNTQDTACVTTISTCLDTINTQIKPGIAPSPVVVTSRTGMLDNSVSGSYTTIGDFELFDSSGSLYLRFTNATISGQPDVYIVLTNSLNPPFITNIGGPNVVNGTSAQITPNELNGNINGTRTFTVPSSVQINDYSHVLIYCRAFTLTFGYGSFTN